MNFEKALNDLPIDTGFDPFAHKTPDDLAYVCLHELDLHSEGEYKISLSLRKQYVKFIQKYGTPYQKSEAVRVFNSGLKQTHWEIE